MVHLVVVAHGVTLPYIVFTLPGGSPILKGRAYGVLFVPFTGWRSFRGIEPKIVSVS